MLKMSRKILRKCQDNNVPLREMSSYNIDYIGLPCLFLTHEHDKAVIESPFPLQ